MKTAALKILLAALLISGSSYGQIDWQKTYGLPNLNESLNFVYPADEPGYFWAAGTTSAVGQDDWFIAKLDSIGNVVWADTLGSQMHNERLWCFHREPATGNMWLSGSRENFEGTENRGVLIKLSPDGATEFEKVSTQTVHEVTGYVSVAGLPDGGAAAILHVGAYGSGFLQRLDANGNEMFSEAMSSAGTYSSFPQMIAPLPDGRFYVLHNSGNPNSNSALAEISLRTSSGSVIWRKIVMAPTEIGKTQVQNILADKNDGSVYALTRQRFSNAWYLNKISTAGDSLWSAKPGFAYGDFRLKPGPDETMAIVTSRSIELLNPITGTQTILRDFSEAIFYWDRRIYDAEFLPNGRGVVVGQLFSMGSNDGYWIFFEKGSMAVLDEAIVGSVGPQGDDLNPHITETDGSLYLASNFESHDTLSLETMLRKIDPADGAEIWSTFYSGPKRDIIAEILQTSDGNLLLVIDARDENSGMYEDELIIRKINPVDGAVIWETHAPNRSLQANSVAAATDDGGAVIIYHGSVPDPTSGGFFGNQGKALRISSDGDILWQSWIEPVWSSVISTGQRFIQDILALQDGDFMAVGMEDEYSGVVIRINGVTGESQLLSLLDPVALNDDRRAESAIQTESGDLLVSVPNYQVTNGTDSLWLYRLTPDGTVLLRKSIRLADSHYGTRLMKTTDGRLLLLIHYDPVNAPFLPGGLIVREINENFETLSETALFDDNWRPASSKVLSDGSLALAREVSPTNSRDLLMAKTAMLPSVSTKDISFGTGSFEVYPNPVNNNDALQVVLGNPFSGEFTTELLTLDGRLISSFKKEKKDYLQTFTFGNLPKNNSFWLRVSYGDKIATRLVLRH
ncbi:MAG: hypothetical protein H6576_07720 [Lewinellaceae bacterium]|nr:hypothetical protein [Saprospiraceae bacterium]MCB9343568.1 hypothetical protein [Lewinellaceae bacterium]